jgi:hypothetical protein
MPIDHFGRWIILDEPSEMSVSAPIAAFETSTSRPAATGRFTHPFDTLTPSCHALNSSGRMPKRTTLSACSVLNSVIIKSTNRS